MVYYIVISFIFFLLVDYKYIYSIVDSKFLFKTPGSKLKKETGKSIFVFKFQDKFDVYALAFIVLVLFLFNYSISTIILNTKPLNLYIVYKTIDLCELFEGYETVFQIIYHISCMLCIFFVSYNNIESIRKVLLKYLYKVVKKEEKIVEKDNLGYLIARDENDECLYISDDSLYQNLLITGSIGSGKTSGAISRITENLIKSGKGGLILDVKGNFVDSVIKMCKQCGRENDIQIISKNSNSYFELLENDISSLELANRLKLVINLLSPTNNSDSYWLDKVENVLMNMIVLMKYIKRLNVIELHKMVSDDSYLKNIIGEIKGRIKEKIPDDKTSFELANAISFIQNEYFKLDTRVNSIIKSEITRLTIPLITDFDIYNQFCIKNNKKLIDFKNNKIVVLSLNIGENRALSKIISTFLKLSFQKYILSNISNSTPTFFIADEFQEFCNTEDAHFLSLSREAKCINIISTQSYSSLKNNLKDKDAANVIIQNLVNKIWFRNDDNYTISEAIKQLGKVNVIKENTSISEAGVESKKYLFREGFKNKKSSITKALNYVKVKENEYDENFFTRELKTFEALMFISTKEGIVTKKVIFERWK